MTARKVADTRRRRLIEAMKDAGLDVVVLYGNAWQNDYLRYAADFGILEGEGIAVVTSEGETLLYLDDPFEADRAAVECPGLETVVTDDIVADAAAAIERLGNRRIAAGPKRHLPYGLARRREDRRFDDATPILDRLLMVKAEEELQAVRRAARLADEGYAVFRNAARVGRKDYELIAEIEAFFRANGVEDNFMIIGAGGPEVRGMAPPSGKMLKAGDLVTTELTPCVDGYYVQICRTLVIGKASEAQKKAFAVYHEAMIAGIDAVRPGITAAAIAKAENDVFRRHGLGNYVTSEYTRVRGHGLGLFPDTKPHILEDVTTTIEEGMSLIVHPNTYHPDVGYMVLGDSLIVTGQGAQVLTTTPRELFSMAADRRAA
ncbi:Xaa-Pro peptidase family protein [Chelativorans sp. AA-79]|uniref:M24 family metallopeptidase n=1 Tax=Chelativorans sp. AA-79 TaxID=3028735 RepID=UPI0023F87ABB|nr:Xaa-Pro peptidase family protein [Chelativorans sp. AA-79]WEX10778.1 Xaa-Pro peptidase family protein [Chelativorans sp. AA-79]